MTQAQVTVLEGAKLYKIGHASHTAEVTMTDLALRERLRAYSDIGRTKTKLIRNGEKIVDADYIAFWKGMQDAGAGVIIYAKRGRPDRFEWHYSLKKVAKAALEGTNESAEKIVVAKPKPKARPARQTKPQAKPVTKPEAKVEVKPSKILYIPLRKDFNFELNLPGDISREELNVIANALQRLSA